MTSYTVVIRRNARRQLGRVPPDVRERIARALRALSSEPRPRGTKKLQDVDGWRIRVGDYRVLYQIDDAQHVVTVAVVGHRGDVYR